MPVCALRGSVWGVSRRVRRCLHEESVSLLFSPESRLHTNEDTNTDPNPNPDPYVRALHPHFVFVCRRWAAFCFGAMHFPQIVCVWSVRGSPSALFFPFRLCWQDAPPVHGARVLLVWELRMRTFKPPEMGLTIRVKYKYWCSNNEKVFLSP